MTDSTRKLAAIVFTDIVGFTKLTSEDQSQASSLLKTQRKLFQPIVAQFNGSWIKEMGDGLILTFDTVTDAVNCCIKLQETSKEIDYLNLRIGIHEGEILIEENDIIGDDVNIASRIEPFSAPGGIAISNKVHDAIVREAEFTSKYLGKPKLKGVGQKVEVYCITSHGLPETILSDVSAKLENEGFQWNLKNTVGIAASVIGLFMLINFLFLRIGFADEEATPSIAILPFENKGAEADEFYAYGISSDLIADVTSAGLIRVASLKDIEKLDFQNMETAEIAKKLFVRYIAQGTLWKMDSVFQLSMEIFDTKESKVVYTKRWQTNWTDLSTIKGDLSDNILETLEIKILQDPEKHILDSNPKAYAYYLEAKHKFEKREDRDDIVIARELLNRAIELDDNFIKAKLFLGATYRSVGDYDKAMSTFTIALNQAEDLGDKGAIGRALGSIGILHFYRGEIDQTLDYFKRVLVISEEMGDKAGYGRVLNNIGAIYNTKGELDQALDYFNRSLVISEELGEKTDAEFTNIAIIYGKRGEYDEALDYFNRSLAINKEINDRASIAGSYINIGLVHNQRGEYDQAIEYQKRALEINEELGNKNGLAISLGGIGNDYSNIGKYDEALDYFNRSLAICEEYGYNGIKENILYSIGNVYSLRSEYVQSADYYTQSIKIKEELGEESSLGIITNLHFVHKQLGKEYDIQEINRLIAEADQIDYRTNFSLFRLLDDNLYLEKAYAQIEEKGRAMEENVRKRFLSFPIPKRIIEKYNSENS